MVSLRLIVLYMCISLVLTGCSGWQQNASPPLIRAADRGDANAVRTLLARGADVQARDAQGRTALMYAAEKGDSTTVQALLVNGANPNVGDWKSWTPLMYGALSGDLATVQTLLTHKAHANIKADSGWTALMSATVRGYTAIAQALLAAGAEPNAKDKNELTALLLAVQGGHVALVQALLDSGADAQVKNKEGKTVLAIAESEGFTNIAQLLKQAIDRTQEAGKSPASAEPTRATNPTSRPARQTAAQRPATGAPAGDPGAAARAQSKVPEQPAPATAETPPAATSINQTTPPAGISGGPAAAAPVDFGRYYALVIGNNAYSHLRPLKTAVNDAVAVAELMGSVYGYTVTLLTNATREETIAAFDSLRASLTERDNLLIYYAGHGVLDTGEERGYWLPVNARQDSRVHWIPTTTITDALKAMAAKHVLVVADSCYSGTLTRGIDVVTSHRGGSERDTYIARIAQKRSRTVLTSGGIEPVLDTGGGEHSVFAKAFLTVLQENADVLDGQQLFSTIRRPIVLNSLQTPEYSDIRQAGHDGGDFLFVRRPAVN